MSNEKDRATDQLESWIDSRVITMLKRTIKRLNDLEANNSFANFMSLEGMQRHMDLRLTALEAGAEVLEEHDHEAAAEQLRAFVRADDDMSIVKAQQLLNIANAIDPPKLALSL